MKRTGLILLAVQLFFIISCSGADDKDMFRDNNVKWIDLSHDFSSDTIYWPTDDGFKLEEIFHGMTEKGYFYSSYRFCASEHGGTHIDAPVHFAEGKNTVDQIPLSRLIGDGIMIDVSKKALSDRDYQVSVDDLVMWEKKYGKIPDGSIVLLKTGYARYWPDREKYMGTAETGHEAVEKLHFPGLHPDAARWLVDNRNINSIGIDTPSIDFGQSTLYESHRILFSDNIPAFENVASMDELPAKGFRIYALPMKIKGGSGAPLRIVALING